MPRESIVRYSYDPLNPPPLTDEQEARLAALAALPEDAIDFSDIPPLTDAFFKDAIRNPFLYPPVHLSADIIEWFSERATLGSDVTMAINQVLLAHIAAEKKKRPKKTA